MNNGAKNAEREGERERGAGTWTATWRRGEDPLTSFFNAAAAAPLPPSPILRGQSSSCKGVYKSCLNYKLATEREREREREERAAPRLLA